MRASRWIENADASRRTSPPARLHSFSQSGRTKVSRRLKIDRVRNFCANNANAPRILRFRRGPFGQEACNQASRHGSLGKWLVCSELAGYALLEAQEQVSVGGARIHWYPTRRHTYTA